MTPLTAAALRLSRAYCAKQDAYTAWKMAEPGQGGPIPAKVWAHAKNELDAAEAEYRAAVAAAPMTGQPVVDVDAAHLLEIAAAIQREVDMCGGIFHWSDPDAVRAAAALATRQEDGR